MSAPTTTPAPDWADAVTTAADALQRVYDALEHGLIENPHVPSEHQRHRLILTHADAMAIHAAHALLAGTTPDTEPKHEISYDSDSVRWEILIDGEIYRRKVVIVPTMHDDSGYDIRRVVDRKPLHPVRLEMFNELAPDAESLFEDWLQAKRDGRV